MFDLEDRGSRFSDRVDGVRDRCADSSDCSEDLYGGFPHNARSVDDRLTSGDPTGTSVDDIAESIDDIARSADDIARSVDDIAESVDDMARSIDDIAESLDRPSK